MAKAIEDKSQIERLSFFSDAVIAIAITLLALDLKFEKNDVTGLLSLKNLQQILPKFLSFVLSFIIIAVLWSVHYEMYYQMRKIDKRIIAVTLVWLFFIVTIPFSASLVSSYFGQPLSSFIYSLNVLLLTACLNYIWDYAEKKPGFINEKIPNNTKFAFRISCNVGVINTIVAVILSFFLPRVSLALLLLRQFVTYLVKLFYKYKNSVGALY